MIARRTIFIAGLAIAVAGGGVALARRLNRPPSLPVASGSIATATAKSAGSQSSAPASGEVPPDVVVATHGDFRNVVTPTAPGSTTLESTWSRFQSRLAHCADKEASIAGGPETQARRSGEQTVIVLDLELRRGNFEVVDVSFPSRGGITDAAMGCAVKALRGQVIPSSGARGREGTRVQIPFPMQI